VVHLPPCPARWLDRPMDDDATTPHTGQLICGSCPLRSPYRSRNSLPVGPGPSPTVQQALRRAAVDWRPFTARIRGRTTLAIRVSDFRSHLASALGFVQRGDIRVVLLRGRSPVAAIVPVADFWFLFQVEQELRRLGWSADRRAPLPETIAQAIVTLQPPDTGSGASRIVARPQMREAAPWVTFDRAVPLAKRLREWRSPAGRGW
jgi:antitoxin (DNA-binding transcriptional repressor) of toxin-antitoxin stability system